MSKFADARDGDVYITHLMLLLGCALPLWLARSSVGSGPFAGLLSVCVGDSFAAVVGSRYSDYF